MARRENRSSHLMWRWTLVIRCWWSVELLMRMGLVPLWRWPRTTTILGKHHFYLNLHKFYIHFLIFKLNVFHFRQFIKLWTYKNLWIKFLTIFLFLNTHLRFFLLSKSNLYSLWSLAKLDTKSKTVTTIYVSLPCRYRTTRKNYPQIHKFIQNKSAIF